MTSFIDTNVLIRFLTGSPEEKFRGVYQFFKDMEDGNIHVELKLIVLFQTIFVLKSFYQVPKFEIVRAVAVGRE
jgi:predicted nucleic-acid-binding protein